MTQNCAVCGEPVEVDELIPYSVLCPKCAKDWDFDVSLWD